jgi:hypothetical protein
MSTSASWRRNPRCFCKSVDHAEELIIAEWLSQKVVVIGEILADYGDVMATIHEDREVLKKRVASNRASDLRASYIR